MIEIEKMTGKVMVMTNLKMRRLGGFESHGMLMCVFNQDQTKIELISPSGDIGERVYIEGH